MATARAEVVSAAVADDRLEQLVAGLRRRYGERITGELTFPPSEGSYAPLPHDMHPGLRRALEGRGMRRLYAHQVQVRFTEGLEI